ncbi:hypothetical protein [Micromonospora chersina]|uniref:hypothetical protein n=1 Tax=Micromonospora chersina TaxID=47854 RepID=UPI003711AAB6
MTVEPPIDQDQQQPAPPARRGRLLWVGAATVVALVAAGGAAYAIRSGGSDEDTAVERCQTAITAKLKSPSTAKYGDKVDVTTQKGNFGTYFQVFGTVDAQNGFGATIRGAYHCKVTLENGSWRVDESSVAEG